VGLVHSRDITERKQSEKALQEKERLLSDAQRIGHIGSWSYDIPQDHLTFSDEMYRLLDVLPEEFQHNKAEFLALVYPSDRPTAAKWMADIDKGMPTKNLNFRLFHKNGELCYLQSTGAVEFDTMGTPVRFIGTTQDVTERQVAEIQINQQIKRLSALSEIDRAIISSFDRQHTLSVILSNTISQLQVDAAAVFVLDPECQVLDYAAGQGFRTKMIEDARVLLGEIHAGRAAKERRMIRIVDLRETTNTEPFRKFVMAEGFVSYLGVPLIVKGKVKGVLEVYQRSLLQPYQDWLDFFNALAGQAAIAVESTGLLTSLQSTNQELIQAYEATIEGWSRAMDLRDRETAGHTERVTRLTLDLARALGMDEARLIHIRRGSLLHDIGKLGVPDHILLKTSELTVEERESIEKHTDFAYEMLAPIPYLKPALNIPYFHHEKWDGSGYPLGLMGEQIPLECRIFSVVDVWDALLSDRPYRKAWSREAAMEYIRTQAGAHFDPRVVECFLAMLGKAR
jgi:HD-GYP domain-containing protein (c-di-GMP phosphodiesterase class II)